VAVTGATTFADKGTTPVWLWAGDLPHRLLRAESALAWSEGSIPTLYNLTALFLLSVNLSSSLLVFSLTRCRPEARWQGACSEQFQRRRAPMNAAERGMGDRFLH